MAEPCRGVGRRVSLLGGARQEVRSEPEAVGAGRKLVPAVASPGLFLLSGCLGWPCSPHRSFLFGTHWSEAWAGAWPSPWAAPAHLLFVPGGCNRNQTPGGSGVPLEGELLAPARCPGRRGLLLRPGEPRPGASGPGSAAGARTEAAWHPHGCAPGRGSRRGVPRLPAAGPRARVEEAVGPLHDSCVRCLMAVTFSRGASASPSSVWTG